MKNLLHLIYLKKTYKSKPVTDALTGRKEIAIVSEFFGFVVKITYQAV